MADITIQIGAPNEYNLTCYGFHVWAGDFLEAEQAYARQARQGSLTPHFLCCQSIELSLKAFLSLKGFKRRVLAKAYGHNLQKTFAEARANGLDSFVPTTTDDVKLLRVATTWYDGAKRLQYFDVSDALRGFRHAPDLSNLESFATRLQVQSLRNATLNA